MRLSIFRSALITAAALWLVVGLAACSTSRPSPPDDQRPPESRDWTIATPAAGATNSLRVMFPAPLDHAVLSTLSVLAPNDRPLAGESMVGDGDLMWSFAPNAAWQAGNYQLVVGPARLLVPFSIR